MASIAQEQMYYVLSVEVEMRLKWRLAILRIMERS